MKIDYGKRFLDNFLTKHGYYFCEVCGNPNGRLHIHHLYFRSRIPKHPEVNNEKNLLLVCEDCHLKFHGQQLKSVFNKLEKERGLKELYEVHGIYGV